MLVVSVSMCVCAVHMSYFHFFQAEISLQFSKIEDAFQVYAFQVYLSI